MENLTKFIEVYNKGTKPLPEIIQELKSTSSKNDKEAILKREHAVNNEELKQILYWCYDPQFNFYTTKIPEYETKREIYDAVSALYQIVENICSRKVTGNAALDYIAFVLANTVKTDTLIVESVIKRDLDCGVQESTINKVWKDLIKDPPYMSYSLFNEKLINSIKLPCYSEIKQDGLFADVKVTADSVNYSSRSGKDLKFKLPEIIENKLKVLARLGNPYVLHGEALVIAEDGSFEPREIGNGYLNSDGVDPEKVCLVCWDVVKLEEYQSRQSKVPFVDRRKGLCELITHINEPKHFQSTEAEICECVDDIIDHFVSARERGLEGTVVKNFNLLWADKKVKDGVKIKNQFDCEYQITGFQEHSKKAGQVGAIFVESEDGKIKFKVGSGLTDAQRKLYYKQQERLIGKIVTIRGNDIVSSESKDTYSIFLPRLIELREDKTVADTYEKVLESRDSIIDLLKMIGVKK